MSYTESQIAVALAVLLVVMAAAVLVISRMLATRWLDR
jgi:hypothetical protein